ncbi:MAG: hypothetical protein LCH63_10195 [Candidatus Melainabacteria bacterium]|nr:hypothetical protein [Candidatus Melainabacteria bacterium]
MNYEENQEDWKVGDLVIHDSDAKRDNMLMVVIGRSDVFPTMLRTIYVDQDYHQDCMKRGRLKVWLNDKKYLHAPERFGINGRRKEGIAGSGTKNESNSDESADARRRPA